MFLPGRSRQSNRMTDLYHSLFASPPHLKWTPLPTMAMEHLTMVRAGDLVLHSVVPRQTVNTYDHQLQVGSS